MVAPSPAVAGPRTVAGAAESSPVPPPAAALVATEETASMMLVVVAAASGGGANRPQAAAADVGAARDDITVDEEDARQIRTFDVETTAGGSSSSAAAGHGGNNGPGSDRADAPVPAVVAIPAAEIAALGDHAGSLAVAPVPVVSPSPAGKEQRRGLAPGATADPDEPVAVELYHRDLLGGSFEPALSPPPGLQSPPEDPPDDGTGGSIASELETCHSHVAEVDRAHVGADTTTSVPGGYTLEVDHTTGCKTSTSEPTSQSTEAPIGCPIDKAEASDPAPAIRSESPALRCLAAASGLLDDSDSNVHCSPQPSRRADRPASEDPASTVVPSGSKDASDHNGCAACPPASRPWSNTKRLVAGTGLLTGGLFCSMVFVATIQRRSIGTPIS